MKKITLITLCIVCVAALTGCSLFVTNQPADFESYSVVVETESGALNETPWEVTLSAENVTAGGLTLKAELTGEGNVNTGAAFWIDEYTEDSWQEARHITDEEIAWDALAYGFTDNKMESNIGWEHIYGTLESGKYRLGKKFFDDKGTSVYCYVLFEIKE